MLISLYYCIAGRSLSTHLSLARIHSSFSFFIVGKVVLKQVSPGTLEVIQLSFNFFIAGRSLSIHLSLARIHLSLARIHSSLAKIQSSFSYFIVGKVVLRQVSPGFLAVIQLSFSYFMPGRSLLTH